MKKNITLALLLTVGSSSSAFKRGWRWLTLIATIQNGGSGIRVSTDFGLGENMSLGLRLLIYYLYRMMRWETNQNLEIELT
jgi:hypothetical protein